MLELHLASTAFASSHASPTWQRQSVSPWGGGGRWHRAAPVTLKAYQSNERLKEAWGTRFTRFLEDPNPPPGSLILLRHGMSELAVSSPRTFTGWADPDLSEVGEVQAEEAARAIKEAGYTFDVVYTSMLKRAVRTTWLLMQELDCIHLPCWKTWRLNERCYGAVTGQPLAEVQARHSKETVASWRRSLEARPPPFGSSHPHNPSDDPRYQRWHDRRGVLRPVAIPNGESMGDTIGRCLPVWKQEILPELRKGKSVLVVAHGNTIRAIVQAIDDLSNDEVCELEVPAGIPLVYRFAPTQVLGGGATDAAAGVMVVRRPPPPSTLPQPYVVIIRHGKTGHNKLGLFTGWEDVALADEGRQEASRAGKMLRDHGVHFDVVYTSWLQRAIETAWLVLEELDASWLPIHKSWRLNERMYGSLTGLSKKKTRTVYGEKQFKEWRRSYDTQPPPVSSFSQHYPGNDQRYVDNMLDVRLSVKETLIRSLERGRVTFHRKLPRTESLKDCMDRTIPYFVNNIQKNSIDKGKSVLIASSENAIRGLLMHLLDIPTDQISNIEIPTGLPLVFDMRHKCLKLLEGNFQDYNFGKGADLLFTPCEIPISEYELEEESG